MTSSMLSGERRWASSRRGSMTVLGKVAVPKPINLPSQRLENHGEDPNVAIVPKGTLSWGSKSSSSASNAWGSSMSPNANRGASSPSHLSARPSSGGSGTRPSSSGSDRALEHPTNAWGSNSRPSSSSGALTSSQTLQTSLRPRSAETRPGSSKLSPFADHITENSVAWKAARTTERLGITQHKNDGFSLSSGDFPTLGSEKDKSENSLELQDHDSLIRPASSSGLGNNKHEASAVDGVPVHANLKGETENSWGRDYRAFNEDGMRPGIEKWQGNCPPYPNAGIPPQHFDPWRGALVNNHHGDVWFRGPPNGPPFANPVAPGGFPIEPFPFYCPNIPPTGLANPPQVPPLGTGPMGQHKNGEAYRPHIPDAYIPPGMPLRPGFYPGPMAYEGYCGPPLAYHNSNERDVPFMGMPRGPTVYNRYPNHNPPEPGNSKGRASVCGPAGKPLTSELAEPSHAPDTAGQYRVLLKQHNERGGKNEPTNWEDSLTTNASCANVRDQQRVTVQESDHIRNAEIDLRTSGLGKEASSQTSGKQGSSSVNNAKPLESIESLNKFDNISERKMDGVSSNTVQIPSRPSAPKDSTLIQKIEGLNAKARDNQSTKSKEEQRNKFRSGNRVENEVSADVVFPKTTPATEVKNPKPHGIGSFGGENNFEPPSFSGTATSRQISHGMQDRSNHRKGGLNTQDTDGWRKNSGVIDSSSAKLEVSNILVGEHKISVDAYERSGSYSQVRRDGESIQTVSDLADSHAQRAKTSKVKESAKQHIKPLQEDEGEQAKKQKAKTPAKLDESNRRPLAMEGSMQRKYAGTSSIQNKQEEFQSSESERVLGKSGADDSSVLPTGNGVCQNSDTNVNRVGKPPILSSETPSETLKNAGEGPVLSLNPSETLYQDVNCADAANAFRHTNVASKNKRTSYKQKQTISSAKTSYVSTTSAAPKVEDDTMASVIVSSGIATNEVNSTNGSGLPMNSASMAESSVNQKKKNNRNSKSKQKTEETSPLAALPSAIPKEANLSRSSVVNKPQEDIEFDQGSLQSRSLSKDSNQYSGQRYLENEESYGRTNSQLKSQHSRRMPRNMQANRQAEKSRGSDVLMWAPVKSQDKTEIPDDLSERTKTEVVIPAKCDQQQVHNLKNKRAEMERYVPKPVAKEMAQQGSLQQMVSSISQAPDDSDERFDSGPQTTRHTNIPVERAGSGMESKNRDSRQTRSRQGKAHGSWRQRNPTESSGVGDMEDGGNPGSNSFENVQLPMESQQVQMSETSFLKRQTKHGNDTSKPDGSNNPDNHDSAVQVSVSALKDHKAINMERQVPFRRQKGTWTNHDVDQKKNAGDTGKTEVPLSSNEHNEPDADAVFKENLSIGERLSSHWQPKFQASNNYRGSKPNTKDSTRHVGAFPEGYDKESNALMAQPSEKSRGGETPNIGNPEVKRERRNAPSKGHPHSPSQVAVGSSEEVPTGMDPRHQQHPSSGVRKNGNQNRFGKGHESPGDWIMSAQDDGRHHNRPTNQDRRGPDRRYHPVGAHGDSTSDNFERTRDGDYIAGGKFRERGQTHSRRGGGNFSGH